MPKLYANTVLVVLNSRIRIVGGRDTDTSSADMSITTTMIKDITSQLTEGTCPTDGMQGQVTTLALTKEETLPVGDDAEMGPMRVSHGCFMCFIGTNFHQKEKPQEVGRSLAA